jgi:hypothetical protein
MVEGSKVRKHPILDCVTQGHATFDLLIAPSGDIPSWKIQRSWILGRVQHVPFCLPFVNKEKTCLQRSRVKDLEKT